MRTLTILGILACWGSHAPSFSGNRISVAAADWATRDVSVCWHRVDALGKTCLTSVTSLGGPPRYGRTRASQLLEKLRATGTVADETLMMLFAVSRVDEQLRLLARMRLGGRIGDYQSGTLQDVVLDTSQNAVVRCEALLTLSLEETWAPSQRGAVLGALANDPSKLVRRAAGALRTK